MAKSFACQNFCRNLRPERKKKKHFLNLFLSIIILVTGKYSLQLPDNDRNECGNMMWENEYLIKPHNFTWWSWSIVGIRRLISLIMNEVHSFLMSLAVLKYPGKKNLGGESWKAKIILSLRKIALREYSDLSGYLGLDQEALYLPLAW